MSQDSQTTASSPGEARAELTIRELREKLAQQQASGRAHEYVKTLVALGDELGPSEEQIELYLKAADLYTNKFMNQAEALRTFEKIRAIDPQNAQAIDFLRQMYDKRRDWEKLIALNRDLAATIRDPQERAKAYKAIAELATERVKKPELCVELWNVVLESDSSDHDALKALSQLYERVRRYEELADVLERLWPVAPPAEQAGYLSKLGQVVGDRLKDEARAVAAYQNLLSIATDAQTRRMTEEQLKKRYVVLGAWDELEQLYAESNKWDEFIRILESNEARASDTASRVAMLMKVAELWMTQKGKPDRASRAYEKVLGLEPDHLEAAERLIMLYANSNNPRGLVTALEVKLKHVREPAERVPLLREIGAHYESRLNNKALAFERFEEAFRLAPDDVEAQADVERAAEGAGLWERLLEVYRRAVDQATKARRSEIVAALRLKLGRVAMERLGQVEEAIAEYRAALALQPNNDEALAELEQLYGKAGNYRELLDVYEKRKELAPDGAARAQVLARIAKLSEEHLGDRAGAIRAYREWLELTPGDALALSALDRLYAEAEQWAECAEILGQRLEAADLEPALLVELKFRLAQLLERHLGEPERALEQYREILFLEESHQPSRQALEALLEHKLLRGEAARILENVYEALGDYAGLLRVSEVLVDTAEPKEARVAVLRRMALIAATQLGDRRLAFQTQMRAVGEDPSNAEARQELESFAEHVSSWSEVIKLYSKIAKRAKDFAIARDYWLRVAELHEQLGDGEAAAQSYTQLLKLDAADTRALEALERLYRAARSWSALIEIYRQRIELATDAAQRQDLLTELARVYEQELGDVDQAAATYREILRADANNRAALSALEQLLLRQERWDELAENLETQLAHAASEGEQLDLMLRAAELREQRKGDAAAAIESYRLVLERDPGNERALEALERLAREGSQALVVAEILEPLYRRQGSFQKLVAVQKIQIAHAADVHHKIELLHRLAELQEDAMADSAAAFDTFAEALEADPANELTVQALERLARATGKYADLASVYETLATRERDAELAATLYLAAGRIVQNDVGDVERAITDYSRALDVHPGRLPAIEALELLLQSSERYSELSRLLRRKADILDDPEDKKKALFEAANLEELVLEREDEAIRAYEQILEVDPEDLRSHDALVNLFLRLQRWEDLLKIHARKVELIADADEKKNIYYQMGAVYEQELKDFVHAIESYRHVLDIDPDDLKALGRLDALYQRTGNWHELLHVLTHEVGLTPDPVEATAHQFRIAELYRLELHDVARAVELYADVLRVVPDHTGALQALETLMSGSVEPLAAAAVLESVYEDVGNYRGLIKVVEVQAALSDDAFAKIELLHRAGRLHEEALGDRERAFDAFAESVRVDSQNEDSLGSVERLALALNAWPKVAALYDAEVSRLTGEPERAVNLGLRLAQIYEVQLEQTEPAIERYQRVLDGDPENLVALRALDRLYQQSGHWEDLARVLAREADLAETPDAILEFKYRLGQVYERRIGDYARAIDSFREVIEAAPEHEPTLMALETLFRAGIKQPEIGEILEALYQAASEYDKLIDVYRAQLAHLNEPEARLAMYARIALIQEEQHADLAAAFLTYADALLEGPLEERVGREIERLAGMIDNGWETLAHRYADLVADEARDPVLRAAIARRLARVFEMELSDPGRAQDAYACALQLVEDDVSALAELDRLFTEQENWGKLAEVLEQLARALNDDREKTQALLRLAAVHEDQLQQPAQASVALRAVFDELDPNNEDAITALARIYEVQGEWDNLALVYQRQLDNAVGEVEEANIRTRMARLAADRLGKLEEAIEDWKRVLELRGEDLEALDALGGIYERQERWPELSEVLERQFDAVETDEDRVAALTRRARLFSKALRRDDEALEVWQRVLDIDFTNVTALRAVADIWRSRGNTEELVHALHTFVDRSHDVMEPAELAGVYAELGEIYTTTLNDPLRAAEAWTALIDVDPGHFRAMDELEKLYRAEQQLTDVVAVKMKRAAALTDPEEKIRELVEVVDLWKNQIGEFEQAVPALEQILQVDPAHEQAFRQLERVHQTAERWEALVELYLNRLDYVEEAAARAGLLRQIAVVFEERLGDSGQAFDAAVSSFEADSSDANAEYVGRLAAATSRWPELLQATNDRLAAEQDVARQIQLCLRLGKWYGEDLNRQDYAQQYYAQVSHLDPNNAQVLRQMARIYRHKSEYAQSGQALQRALEVATAVEDRRAILTDIGDLLEHHLERENEAIAHYRRALEIDSHYPPAVEALERLFANRGEYDELAKVLVSKVESLNQEVEIAATELRLGELYEKRLGNDGAAADAYRRVVEIDSTNPAALKGLERVYERLEKWGELAEVLTKQLLVVETERERVDTLLRLAGIEEGQFIKPEDAVVHFRQAVELDPGAVAAHEGLERCLRRLKRWPELVDAYEGHIVEIDDVEHRVRLYGELARVHADEIGDVDQAINAYEHLVDLDDRHVEAYGALAKLFERQNDFARAIESMRRVADLTTESAERISMLYGIGVACEHKLGDRAEARLSFELVLDLEPSHLASLTALRRIALEEGDWESSASYLEREIAHTEGRRVKAELFVELGNIRDSRLDDREGAQRAWEAALVEDAENEQAAEPLLAVYVAQEEWARAEPLAELLVRKAKGRDRREQHELYKLLGRIATARGDHERAVKAFAQAIKLDVTDQECVQGLADSSFELKDWPTALTNYQKVLTALGEEDVERRVLIYHRIGTIKAEQGQNKQAISNFEKALALGEHRPTLDALVDLYSKARDWKEVAAYKRQILDSVYDDEQRFELLVQIGEVWAENAKEPVKAIEAYQEARELQPMNHVILHKLLELYQATSDWDNMVEAIGAISNLEEDSKKKARYFYAMAQIYRDKIGDVDQAVQLFNDTLDADSTFLEAFERINRVLTKEANWKQLERNYRKMIHRLAGAADKNLEFTLWHQLGLIYRDRIGDAESALAAFSQASQLRPEDDQERTILAELYEVGGRFDEALLETRILISRDPVVAERYNNLYRLALHKRAYDEAWCAAAVLAFLRKADEEQMQFYEGHRVRGMLPVRGYLTTEMWVKNVFHEDENLYVSKIFEMVSEASLRAKVSQLKAQKALVPLDARWRQDLATSTVTFAKTFDWTSRVLGISPPELYIRSDTPGGIRAVPAEPRASIAGKGVLSGFQPHELAFICGRHLAGYRGEHAIRTLFPTQSELTVMLFAAVMLAAPNTPMPSDLLPNIRGAASELRKFLQPVHYEALLQVVKGFLGEGARANIKRWNQAADMTCARAGLVVCGDLEVAKKILSQEQVMPGEVPAKDKMKDLLAYFVSAEYAQVRQALGIQIEVAA